LFAGGVQLSSSGQFGNSLAPIGSVYRPAGVRTHSAVTRPTRPSVLGNQWSSTHSGGYDTVQQSTMPPRPWMYNDLNQHSAGLFADHGGAEYHEQPNILYNNQANAPSALYDQQGSVLYGSSQSTVFTEQGSVFSDGWFCDLCNIALPTAIALNQVSVSSL